MFDFLKRLFGFRPAPHPAPASEPPAAAPSVEIVMPPPPPVTTVPLITEPVPVVGALSKPKTPRKKKVKGAVKAKEQSNTESEAAWPFEQPKNKSRKKKTKEQ